jgi:rhamnosyltransferase
MSPAASIVIRTLNEARWLNLLLTRISEQDLAPENREVIIVDSGSQDETLDIAHRHQCRIEHILKKDFSFGRSLNVGCAAAQGRNLVFISGHCIPADKSWLSRLVAPLESGEAHYVYGRQIGHDLTRFSEHQVFAKYFPASRADAQQGFFCNNANAALKTDIWKTHRFDEELTGLEDMELAKRLMTKGLKVEYVPDAAVAHIHEETWTKIKLRYEREAIALQGIMPEVHVHLSDFLRYFMSGVLHDASISIQERALLKRFPEIVMFRLMQYWGAYRGNNEHRRLSRQNKERYFYPKRAANHRDGNI